MHPDLTVRLDEFQHAYDHPYREHVAELINVLSETMHTIFGSEADGAFWAFHEALFGTPRGEEPWSHHCYTPDDVADLPVTRTLRDLYAYAYFGLILDEAGEPMRIDPAEVYWQPSFPVLGSIQEAAGPDWSGREPLEEASDMACARLVIDGLVREPVETGNEEPYYRIVDTVSPAGLARLGGVSVKTMKNLLTPSSGGDLRLDAAGRIPIEEARRWLAGRPGYRPSVWQLAGDDVEALAPADDSADLGEVLFLPSARDGSQFTPDLTRGGRYTIGPKGSEVQVGDYREALATLSRMRRPSWRRPNAQGHWGLVTGTDWVRRTANELGL